MSIQYKEASEKLLQKFSDSDIIGAFKLTDGYLFSIKPKSWSQDEYVLDGFFKVSSTGVISEYSPVMDPEEFKEALQNEIT
jgi:hypothetical protein